MLILDGKRVTYLSGGKFLRHKWHLFGLRLTKPVSFILTSPLFVLFIPLFNTYIEDIGKSAKVPQNDYDWFLLDLIKSNSQMKTLTDYNFWMSLFNNNSAQMLQNNQSRYETRQSSQNSQNIFNNSNTNTQNTTFNNSQNPFSNQNTSQNLFNNQGTSQNIFNNQGTKNMFSNTNNTQGNLTSMNDGNLQAQFRTMSQQHEIMTIMQ